MYICTYIHVHIHISIYLYLYLYIYISMYSCRMGPDIGPLFLSSF